MRKPGQRQCPACFVLVLRPGFCEDCAPVAKLLRVLHRKVRRDARARREQELLRVRR